MEKWPLFSNTVLESGFCFEYVCVDGRVKGHNTPLLIVSEPSGYITGNAYLSYLKFTQALADSS